MTYDAIDRATQHLPECTVLFAGIEVPARYEIKDAEVFVQAVKLNGFWADPTAGFRDSQIRVWESDIREVECSIASEVA